MQANEEQEWVKKKGILGSPMTRCNCLVNDQSFLGPHHKRYCNFRAPVRAVVVDRAQGQQGPGGDLRFVVNVSGIGARTESPREVALKLIRSWEFYPPISWGSGIRVALVDLEDSEEERT